MKRIANIEHKRRNALHSFFCVVSILLLASSCALTQVYTINYDTLTPSKKDFPAGVQHIGFVVRDLQFPSDSSSQYYSLNNNVFRRDTTNYDASIYKNVLDGFASVADTYFNDSSLYIQLHSQWVSTSDSAEVAPLSPSLIHSICTKYKLEALVTLEHLNLQQSFRAEDHLDYYQGLANIVSDESWHIYLPTQFSEDLSTKLQDTIALVYQAEDLNVLMNHCPTREELFNQAAFEIGKRYAQTYFPYWLTQERELLYEDSKAFSQALVQVKQGNWRQALLAFQIPSVSKNSHTAALGLYDMSICYERMEQFEQAQTALQQALIHADSQQLSDFLKAYQVTLLQRTKDYQKLTEGED